MKVPPINGPVVGVVSLLFVIAELGCSRDARSGTSSGESEAPPRGDGTCATAPMSVDIWKALHHWSSGAPDDAVHVLLDLADTQADAVRYRPFNISEEQFLGLPAAERDALREKMLTTLEVMRDLARELDRRAREARLVGESASAARHLLAMKRLGEANRGPELTLLVDLVGKAIAERADKGMSELKVQEAGDAPRP